jgi:hypothetical protein
VPVRFVITGLDPVIHADVRPSRKCKMEGRIKPGHDEGESS